MRKLTTKQVCEMARGFDGVTEKLHFGSDALCANGRIFATVWHDKNEVNLMLNREQQNQFLEIDGEGFNQLNNAWGAHAINVQLDLIDRNVFTDALKAAWVNSANKRTSIKEKPKTISEATARNVRKNSRPR
jgi:hypothetical protein